MTDNPKPCKGCPWLTANQGTEHPDGWYRPGNLRRLWSGLRAGADMSCHPTDPRNPVSAEAELAGFKRAPDHAKVKECAGAQILKQREFMRWQDDHGADVRAYRRAHPNGLTLDGLRALTERYVFGGTPFSGRRLPRPNLNEPGVGYARLVPWEVRD